MPKTSSVRLYCWRKGTPEELCDSVMHLYRAAVSEGWQVVDEQASPYPSLWGQFFAAIVRLGMAWPRWFAHKLHWLFSDHGIQTGYCWLRVFKHALRTRRSQELLWRFVDSDLALLRDSIDEEISRRELRREELQKRGAIC
jgi:hypothetical protein